MYISSRLVVELLRSGIAEHLADPDAPPAQRSSDSDDDYLIAAAAAAHATLVSGDRHPLELEGSIPVLVPRALSRASSKRRCLSGRP